MAGITGINHINLSVRSIEDSFSFYKDILGFKPLMKSKKSAYFLAGDTWVCIEEDENVRATPLLEYTHVAFSLDSSSFKSLSQKIINYGCKIFKENKSEGESLYFIDPNGHKLEIHVGSWESRLKAYRSRSDITEMEFYDF